ncbi:Retrovirus-related Pol polyprotein from transposon TNT 1-94 [Vitis vinifera]|uniref:Retrovirus-related Pol polyprotein from transposon TNT 1-94 n=1 Tax=Vitis vinifera TaxID=29760 RepID=A0A438GGL8_VITVI|nr:Retrovirus-related Pol polyprotein from transposon TNT 1-94 [Vitis vinifera]
MERLKIDFMEFGPREEPQTYYEVITSKKSTHWIVVMNEKTESLQKNHTWQLVEKPKNQKIVGCKWVFKRNEGILGIEDARFKARLVAKGYAQKEVVDFNEVFSPVVKHSSIRVLLAMVALFDLESKQLDVKTVFLYGEFEMKDLGAVKKILGMEIHRDQKTEEEREYMSYVLYASVVGSIMYVMVCTRIDISYVVNVASRYMDSPRKIHWQAVKWIL